MFDAPRAALGTVALAAGLIGIPVSAPAAVAPAGIALTATDSLAGSNIALIMGPSMIPTPSQQYADTVDALFLQPRGFAGELEVLTTPASPYNLDKSLAEGAQILVDLGVREMRLLTNNPRKVIGLEGYGLKIIERVPLEIEPNSINRRYLETKRDKLHHLLLQNDAP